MIHEIKIDMLSDEQQLPECAVILAEAYNAPPWNDLWTPEKALEKLACFYHAPKFLGWKASIGGKVVGCCIGNIEPYYTGDYYYLKEMFVSVGIQGRGTGAALLDVAKKHLESIDIHTIILFTGKDHFPFGFYQRHGFGVMEEMRMMAAEI